MSEMKITRDMVHVRARQLAMIAGNPSDEVSQSEYEQAKREVTGESDADAILDSNSQ